MENFKLVAMLPDGNCATATARITRFASPPFKSDKELKKRRGNAEEVISRKAVTAVRWFVNKIVHMVSTRYGIGVCEEKEKFAVSRLPF